MPIGLGALALLGYNVARFGDPFDFGYLTQNVAREVRADLHTYGQFSLHYVSRNLWAMWAAGPVIDKQGQLVPIIEGMSLLLTTPAIVYALNARKPRPLVIAALASDDLARHPAGALLQHRAGGNLAIASAWIS